MNNYLFLETNENVAIDARWETLYALSRTMRLNRNLFGSNKFLLSRKTPGSPSRVWNARLLTLESIYHVFVVDWKYYA